MINFLKYLFEKDEKKKESGIVRYKVRGKERVRNKTTGSVWEKDPETGAWAKIVSGTDKPEDNQSLIDKLKRRRTEKEKEDNANRIRQALANIENDEEDELPYDSDTVDGWINQWYADNGYAWDDKAKEWVPPKGKKEWTGYVGQGAYQRDPCSAEWVKKGYLARSCRPGYPMSKNVDEDDAEEWLECVEERLGEKPKTIITFLHSDELYGKDYKTGFFEFNLLDWYKDHGIETKWFPTKDPIHEPGHARAFSKERLDEIMDTIKNSPKPVLIHCSAGIDRTGEVVYYFKHGEPKPEFNSFKNYMSSPQSRADKFRKKWNWPAKDDKGKDGESPMVTYGD